MPSPRLPLSQGDIAAEPVREVGYYGGVRQGFEQARSGIEAVIQHLSGLLQKRPDNGKLERYIRQLQKLQEKLHKLQMRSSRVRDHRVEPKKKKRPAGSPFNPGGPTHRPPDHRNPDDRRPGGGGESANSGRMPWPPHENEPF